MEDSQSCSLLDITLDILFFALFFLLFISFAAKNRVLPAVQPSTSPIARWMPLYKSLGKFISLTPQDNLPVTYFLLYPVAHSQ
jgi:hypothetical protein